MASGTLGQIGNLAQALTTIAHAASKPAFEYSFAQMQHTVIGRLNDEIHKVNEAGGSKAELLQLTSEGTKLAKNVPLIGKFLFDTETNQGRLSTLTDKIATMIGLFSDDDSISAADLTAFDATRLEVVDELNKMAHLSYTGFTDGNIIMRLKNEVAGIEALAPVEGIVDASGAPATNVNRETLTSMETLQNTVLTAQEVTTNSIYTIVDIREHMLSRMADIQLAATEINSTVQLKKLAEVDALKEKYANLLSSISLSYEVSSTMTESLSKQLSKQTPEKGSVLNLFI